MNATNLFGRSLCLALALTGLTAAQANIRTWDGGGTDNNWTTDNNWGGTAPAADDSLIFAGTMRLSPSNNFAADTAFGGIAFNAGAGTFTLGGNRITLGGNVASAADNDQTIGLAMILDAIRTFNVSGAGDLTVSGDLSGAGGLTKTGAGTLLLGVGNNSVSYTGDTIISDGVFGAIATEAFASSSGKLIVESGATLHMNRQWNQAKNTFALDFGGTGHNGLGALRYEATSPADETPIYRYMDITMSAPALVHAGASQIMLWAGLFDMNGYTLTKEGGGILNIRQKAVHNFGDIVVSQGELRFQVSTTFVPSEVTGTITLKGTTLDFWASSSTYPMNVYMEDGSTILGLATGSPVLTGTITLEGNHTIGHNETGRTLTLSGKITGVGGFVTRVPTTVGPGTLIVSGNDNDYSGNTTVRDKSILRVSNTSGSATGSGTVTVQSGGTLSGTGIIGGDGVVESGGTLSPADHPDDIGTLTLEGDLTLAEDAILALDFDETTHDLVAVGGTVHLPASLVLDLNRLDASRPDPIPLITAAGGFTGSPADWPRVELDEVEYQAVIFGNTLLLTSIPSSTLIILR